MTKSEKAAWLIVWFLLAIGLLCVFQSSPLSLSAISTIFTSEPSPVATSTEAPCSHIPTDQFLQRAQVGTTDFVVTYQKLNLPDAYWFLDEDVVFGPDHMDNPTYLGSRGYEFFYDLTPEANFDNLQQIHTTINVYSEKTTISLLRSNQVVIEDLWPQTSKLLPCIDDIRFGYTTNDPDQTAWVEFIAGNYYVKIKTKAVGLQTAIELLKSSVIIVLSELTS